MRKGYIMIFLTIWVIVITMIIFFGVSKIVSNISRKDMSISQKNEDVENDIQTITTSSKEEEEETIYLIKENNGYIAIYIIDKNGDKNLREKTNILTKYLPEIDKEKLQEGIKVKGKKELNRVLEDYE